jgi:hypothetical protein
MQLWDSVIDFRLSWQDLAIFLCVQEKETVHKAFGGELLED